MRKSGSARRRIEQRAELVQRHIRGGPIPVSSLRWTAMACRVPRAAQASALRESSWISPASGARRSTCCAHRLYAPSARGSARPRGTRGAVSPSSAIATHTNRSKPSLARSNARPARARARRRSALTTAYRRLALRDRVYRRRRFRDCATGRRWRASDAFAKAVSQCRARSPREKGRTWACISRWLTATPPCQGSGGWRRAGARARPKGRRSRIGFAAFVRAGPRDAAAVVAAWFGS